MQKTHFQPAHAVRQIETSATLAITQKVRALKAQGVDIIGLSAGEPDYDTPEYIKQAAVNAIAHGKTKYTNVDGIGELKSAICEKFKRENGLDYSLDEINVSPGGKAVIFNALLASLNSQDEVIIPTPCWVSYPDMVTLLGGRPVLVQTHLRERFILNAQQLSAAITKNTKWLILNSPSNPTGSGYRAADLLALAEVLREHPQILVLSDDIYEHLVYDSFEFCTLAQVAPDLKSRILTMNGVSKTYAMTGWRIGYGGGPKWLIKAMAKVMGQSTSNPASISQYAAIAALNGPKSAIETFRQSYQSRKDYTFKQISKVNGLKCQNPDGAFYIFANCEDWIGRTRAGGQTLKNDVDVANALIDDARIAIVPGTAFHAPGHFRLSYSVSEREIEQACQRIHAFAKNLK